jgi:hypothetical protein
MMKKNKMKKFFSYSGFVIMAAILVLACSKTGSRVPEELHQEDQNDDIFPEISFVRPTEGQVYKNGDSVIVEGIASDNKVMYKGKLSLKNEATGLVVAENFYETHFLQALNHGQNTTTKRVKIKVNP